MKKLFLVYESDAWLTTSKLVLMGVYDDISKAILDILEEMSENFMLDGEETRDSVAKMLMNKHQTSGFETNYLIKIANLNEWAEI